MGKIVLLDDLTINQIAAGEVIERPASVVKELVENSIDAGAKNIIVEIKNGGISYIRITDDGNGIMPDDMEIAFERHATSKIRSAQDLDTVKSMGFRGEALASISAIAKVELVSKTENVDIGYKIQVEGGDIIDKHEEGCSKGTTITVRELFYNTPVRYKFLKKDFTESGYIEDVITRIALANPNVAIKLINTGKIVLQTTGSGNIEDVIYNIFGKEVAQNLLPVEYEFEEMIVKGVIGKPNISRSNRTNQLFFVNKRFIKDKILTSAAEQGFKGLLTIGKHGFLVLNIDIDPKKIDVNVHPAKLEIRFQEENKVFKLVYNGIKQALLKYDLVPDTDVDKNETPNDILKKINVNSNLFSNKVNTDAWKIPVQNLENKIEIKEEKINVQGQNDSNIEINNFNNEEIEDIKEEIVQDNIVESNIQEYDDKIIEEKQTSLENVEQLEESTEKESFEEMYKRLFGRNINEAKKEYQQKIEEENKNYVLETIKGNEISLFEEENNNKIKYKYIGIVFSTYILLTIEDELYILDQHAAHERILYEKVKQNYYNEKEKDCQLMLLPDIINLSTREMGIFKDNKEIFNKAGFEVDEFGENTVKLTGVPEFCLDFNTKELFLETLDEINTVARTAKQELEEKFLATIACKSAIKAHMAINEEEVHSLMESLLKLPNPFTCPHGRPTVIKMSKTDIEKKFSRR